MAKFYITTSIPYVNAKPHIGHALEFLQTDVIARYKKINGFSAYLTTGTDDNSLKNVQAAEKLGIKTEELCGTNSTAFRNLAAKIGMSYDSFVRTSIDQDHKKVAEILWKACNKSGDIYKKNYRGFYCVGCETFYTEKDLVNGLCPIHGAKPEIVEEENYFFRLSRYQDRLISALTSGEIQIFPESRRAETLNFIESGLEDFSISRSQKRAHGWGIPVPEDPSQIIYVWFDALGSYLTGAGLPSDKKKFERLWPADMHVIGKDITRFHLIYWPAMLMSADFPLPKSVLIHGFITVEGQKMSKSLGNVIDPLVILDKYGVDPIRYYLMKEISTFQDGDFSEKTLKDAINNELVGNLGNFVNRTLTFISTKMGGKIDGQKLDDKDGAVLQDISRLVDEVIALLDEYQLNIALLKIIEISSLGNRYFQNSEPWKAIKEDETRARKILFVCANICRTLGILIYPYMPSTSESLLWYMKEKPSPFETAKEIKKSFEISTPKILFAKIE